MANPFDLLGRYFNTTKNFYCFGCLFKYGLLPEMEQYILHAGTDLKTSSRVVQEVPSRNRYISETLEEFLFISDSLVVPRRLLQESIS
jgi:hypothetical protein